MENSIQIQSGGFEIKSPKMKLVYKEIADYAKYGLPCLLFGPSGSGKEFVVNYYYSVFKKLRGNPGKLVSINCAGMSPELAKSLLFGHVRGAFTDARTERTGAFNNAVNGVLFLDEISYLPLEIQALLLRALDPGEASKLGSDKTYNTSNVTIIGATNKDPDTMLEELTSRMGKTVIIPGVESRREDVEGAVRLFVKKSIEDRKKEENKMIGETDVGFRFNTGQEIQENLVSSLLPLIERREWPGNFREIHTTIKYSIHRAESKNKNIFLKQVINYFIGYAGRQNSNINKIKTEIDTDIVNALKSNFPNWSREEKMKWAELLSTFKESTFRRKDVEKEMDLKQRALQNKLKDLDEAGIISRSGPKKDICKVELKFPVSKPTEAPKKQITTDTMFHLPETDIEITDRKEEIDSITALLKKGVHVFASGESQSGKTTLTLLLGKSLIADRDVFYYEINELGMQDFINKIHSFLMETGFENLKKLPFNRPFMMHADAAALTGYIDDYFSKKNAPVFLLDNLHKLKSREDLDTLQIILQYWKSITFVFTGDKLSNELIFGDGNGIVEYSINSPK
jgi:DNA-binding NtrC family response regulator